MANNYTDASISPALPAWLFSQAEIEAMDSACNVVCDRDGDDLHLFGEMYFTPEGEDDEGRTMNLLTLLQEKLRKLDAAAYPRITIQGASTCDKKRPDEFGGFAYVITRDHIHSVSTWEWLATQTGANPINHGTTAYIVSDERTAQSRAAVVEAVAGGIASQPAALPIVTVTVRGGLIDDIDASIPAHVIVEDWDIEDDDTARKPARNVWTLAGSLPADKAAKLRHVIAND